MSDDVPPPDEAPQEDADLAAEQECPVTVLGHDSGRYFFLTPEGQFRELAARGLDKTGILSLFGARGAWLYENFPVATRRNGVDGWDLGRAQESLFHQAHLAGLFSPGRSIRGTGVWRVTPSIADDVYRELVVHCGDALLVDGLFYGLQGGVRIGPHWYTLGQPETRPAGLAEGAKAHEAAELYDFISSWSWRAPVHAPRLLLGWLGAAMIAGALAWRPHIQLTGGPGTGKTTLELLLRRLLGSMALPVSSPTEASIRQLLGGAARPVLVDEIETDNMDRARRVIELARLASTDNQAPVSRGSAGGTATSWPIRACFLFSSVLHVRFRPQDLSRICVLELDALPVGERSDGELAQVWARRRAETLGALGPALRRRMIDGWERLKGNIAAYEAAIAGLGKRARVADQLGTLLACAHTLLSDEVVGADEAARLAGDFAVEDITGYDDEEDHSEFLVHLLSTRVPVTFDTGGTRYMPIGELIERSGGALRGTYSDELRQHGLAMVKRDGVPDAYLAIANQHQGLAEIFRCTRWADGTWAQAAMRCDLAFKGGVVSFAGAKVRATWVPAASLPIDSAGWAGGPPPPAPPAPAYGADR